MISRLVALCNLGVHALMLPNQESCKVLLLLGRLLALVLLQRKEETTPCHVNLMRSQVLYRAAQKSRGIKVVLARPIVPPIASSLQRISGSYKLQLM